MEGEGRMLTGCISLIKYIKFIKGVQYLHVSVKKEQNTHNLRLGSGRD
jgi:hypothetical protein